MAKWDYFLGMRESIIFPIYSTITFSSRYSHNDSKKHETMGKKEELCESFLPMSQRSQETHVLVQIHKKEMLIF